MNGFESMKLRTKASGSSIRQEKINDARRMEAFDNENDPSCRPHMFFWIAGENPHEGEQVHLRFYGQRFSNANGSLINFQSLEDEPIEVGDYVYDEVDDTYWICSECAHVDEIHYKGKFTQCNWMMKWQAPDGRILEYPCQDMNSTQYNSGETAWAAVTVGSSQHILTVQMTDDTLALANPQRFYLSMDYSVTYSVTQNDSTSYHYGKGLCKITLLQDQNRSETDRPDLGICDYVPSLTESTQDDNTLENDPKIEIHGGDTIKCTMPKEWTVSITNRRGDNIRRYNFEWNVVSDFDVKQEIDGRTIQLQVNDEDAIGSTFHLQVISSGILVAEQEVTVVDML